MVHAVREAGRPGSGLARLGFRFSAGGDLSKCAMHVHADRSHHQLQVGDPFRFARESRFARWSGTGAVALTSGERDDIPMKHRLDFRCNRRNSDASSGPRFARAGAERAWPLSVMSHIGFLYHNATFPINRLPSEPPLYRHRVLSFWV